MLICFLAVTYKCLPIRSRGKQAKGRPQGNGSDHPVIKHFQEIGFVNQFVSPEQGAGEG